MCAVGRRVATGKLRRQASLLSVLLPASPITRHAQCIGISADAVRTRERRKDELGTKAEIFEISNCRPCVEVDSTQNPKRDFEVVH